MIDVRELYLNAVLVRNIAAGVFAACLAILLYTRQLGVMFSSYKKALAVFAFVFGFIAVFCIIDFDSFWTYFHHVFFPMNDLWLLDPRTDILIMMVPGKFFFDLCVSIVFTVFVLMIMYYILLKILDRKVFGNDKYRSL